MVQMILARRLAGRTQDEAEGSGKQSSIADFGLMDFNVFLDEGLSSV